jgi:3,4-dihydroxy 2-butanone 4-phosphate synthase/GTP cyclohydrolase II
MFTIEQEQLIGYSVSEGGFATIPEALAALRAGKAIIVVDDEQRENEGDLVCAAQFATPSMINFMAVEARGLICLALTGERLDELHLPLMVSNNTDSNQTAFTVSIDASPALGVTTGISAEDRARTIQAVLNPRTRPEDLRRPGHVFPIRAKPGGGAGAGWAYGGGGGFGTVGGADPGRGDLRNSKPGWFDGQIAGFVCLCP